MNNGIKTMRKGVKVFILAILMHIYYKYPELIESNAPILIFIVYVVGFLIIRNGFLKNGATFFDRKKSNK